MEVPEVERVVSMLEYSILLLVSLMLLVLVTSLLESEKDVLGVDINWE